ncbi:hypothetical protein A3K73_04820 [Candidatus Pacearchaeota archaeon RBG_13_36_9]|nr:MAG: hypothetical protein A3K73_04820 [Candidatus Pacearchaeota archaeon RBG_13_36_9]
MKPEINFNRKFEPKGNKVLHGAGQSFETFSNYWNAVGDYKPVIYMEYIRVDEVKQKFQNKIKKMLEISKNLMPQIGLNLKSRSKGAICKEVSEGEYDSEIIFFIKVLKEIKNPSFIRIGYEFDAKGKYNSKDFVDTWKHITDLIKKNEGYNIATVWCACPYNGTESVEPYYPGDDYVDWFGIDVFSARYFKNYSPIEDFLELAKTHKKPVMVGESSPAKTGVDKGEESWDEWFNPYFKWIHAHPIIKAFCYINWDWGKDWKQPEWLNGRIEENEEVRKRYIKELSKPVYIHNKLK